MFWIIEDIKTMKQKTHTTASDIKRALTGRGFIIGVIGMILVIALSSIESIIGAARSEMLLMNGYHAQLVIDAQPLTSSLVDDTKSGTDK